MKIRALISIFVFFNTPFFKAGHLVAPIIGSLIAGIVCSKVAPHDDMSYIRPVKQTQRKQQAVI